MSFSIYEETKNWSRQQDLNLTTKLICTSTQDLAKDEALSVKETFKLYLADHQTHGRGRNENSWSNSENGSVLLASYSYLVNGAPQPITAPLFGLALYQSLKNTWPQAAFSIKAPNDIYLKNEKCAGLLIENIQRGEASRLIIGLGLNVFGHPNENSFQATHLAEHTHIDEKNWHKFLSELYYEFEKAAQGSIATHLNDQQRALLLQALNRNPHLSENFLSISPFGDLKSKNQNTSWRDL